MAEASNGGEDSSEVDNIQVQDDRKMSSFPRAPNKKKHEEELEELNKSIKAKETNIKGLNIRSDEAVQQELRAIRAEKDATINRRRKIDNDLRNLNQEITKQNAALTKVQTNLAYKSEDKINDAIRQLELQLKQTNFSLNQEKKIVAEIDSLKRSKKALGQYLELKKVIDGMRQRQRRMREERDHYFKSVTGLKQREESIKSSAQQGKAKAESVKKELDELFEKKRVLVSEFKTAEKEWHHFREDQRRRQREDFLRKKEEERRLQMEEYEKEVAEFEANREPFDEERQLCQTLITYLHRFASANAAENSTCTETQDSALCQDAAPAELAAEGMFVLRKKSMEDISFCGTSKAGKGGKKSRRERRKTLNKPITHSAEIFAQFSQLNLTAPPSVAEVPACLALLEEKYQYFKSQELATVLGAKHQASIKPDIHIGSCDGSVCSVEPECGSAGALSGAPSFTESAISESIPSTPEVQQDSLPPRFPGLGSGENVECPSIDTQPRRLSHDSGACELEGQASSDEQTPQEEKSAPLEALASQIMLLPGGAGDVVVDVASPQMCTTCDSTSSESEHSSSHSVICLQNDNLDNSATVPEFSSLSQDAPALTLRTDLPEERPQGTPVS